MQGQTYEPPTLTYVGKIEDILNASDTGVVDEIDGTQAPGSEFAQDE